MSEVKCCTSIQLSSLQIAPWWLMWKDFPFSLFTNSVFKPMAAYHPSGLLIKVLWAVWFLMQQGSQSGTPGQFICSSLLMLLGLKQDNRESWTHWMIHPASTCTEEGELSVKMLYLCKQWHTSQAMQCYVSEFIWLKQGHPIKPSSAVILTSGSNNLMTHGAQHLYTGLNSRPQAMSKS